MSRTREEILAPYIAAAIRHEPQFGGLPEELLSMAFNYVRRPPINNASGLTISQLNDAADLHHLQLVDRRTYAVVTQALYERLELEVASSMSNSNAYIFTKPIPGHDLIRELHISLDVGYDEDPRKAYQYLEMLLENLPQDALSRFTYAYSRKHVLCIVLILVRCSSHRPLPPQLVKKLWRSQGNLKNLELLPSAQVDVSYDPTVGDLHAPKTC